MPPKGSIGNLIFKGAPKAKTSGAPLLKDSDNYQGHVDAIDAPPNPQPPAPEPGIALRPMDIATEGLIPPPKKKRSRKRAKRAKNAP